MSVIMGVNLAFSMLKSLSGCSFLSYNLNPSFFPIPRVHCDARLF
jgi:hypothetical protein